MSKASNIINHCSVINKMFSKFLFFFFCYVVPTTFINQMRRLKKNKPKRTFQRITSNRRARVCAECAKLFLTFTRYTTYDNGCYVPSLYSQS